MCVYKTLQNTFFQFEIQNVGMVQLKPFINVGKDKNFDQHHDQSIFSSLNLFFKAI